MEVSVQILKSIVGFQRTVQWELISIMNFAKQLLNLEQYQILLKKEVASSQTTSNLTRKQI